MIFFRLLLIVALAALTGQAQAVTYYVSPSGSNANAGTSIAAPKQTIGAATALANPGDVIEVRAGTYTENVVITRPGASNAWITLRGYPGDAMPVVRRTGSGSTIYFYHQACEDAVTANLSGNTDCMPFYWIVQGLEVRGSATGGADGNAIKIDTPKVRVIGNKLCCAVADVVKIVRTANDVEVINNEIWQNSAITTPSANAQGIDIVGADRIIVRGNHFHDIPDIGVYAKGNARNPLFESNLFVNIGGSGNGHALMLGQETDIELLRDGNFETYDGVIRNNVVLGSTWACFAISSSSNARAVHNSCYNTGSLLHGSIFLSNESLSGQGSQGIEVANNIIVANPTQPAVHVTTGAMALADTLYIHDNIYWTTTGVAPTFIANSDDGPGDIDYWQSSYAAWTAEPDTSRVVNPQFRSTTGGWNALTLLGTSPAINKAGGTISATRDISNFNRDSRPDIGAREFRGTVLTDRVGPSIAATIPENAAVNVLTSSGFSVTFDEPIDCFTVKPDAITVTGLSGTVTCGGNSIAWSPTADLPAASTLAATVSGGIRDLAGNPVRGTRRFFFSTVSAAGAGDDFTFLAYGDSRAGAACSENGIHMSLVARMVTDADAGAAMVFHLGDMVVGYNNQTNWVNRGACTADATRGSLKEIIAPLKDRTPVAGLTEFFYPVIGNHDDDWGSGWYPGPAGFNYGHGFCDVFEPQDLGMVNHTTKSYWQDKTGRVPLYTDPEFYASMCSKAARAAYPDLGYYMVRYKSTRFIITRINTDYYDLEECGTCSGTFSNYDHYYNIHQLHWLDAQLAAAQADATTKHVVVLLHAPVITSSYGHAAFTGAPALLSRFTAANKVKLILQGHNHVYERSYPSLSNVANPGGYRADANGFVAVTTGGGGSFVHGFNSLGPLTAVGNTEFHYIRFTVNGTTISGQVIRAGDGNVIDTFSTTTR